MVKPRVRVAQRLTVLAVSMGISTVGKQQILKHEGSLNRVYLDMAGVPTVCMGTTKGLSREDVGQYFSPARCEARNRAALGRAERAVRAAVLVPLTQEQFDSLVSFVYNVGEGAFRKSTLLRKLNRKDYKGAGEEMLRWHYAGGKPVRGLLIRRTAEAAPFMEHR